MLKQSLTCFLTAASSWVGMGNLDAGVPFEGRIEVEAKQGAETTLFLYTVSSQQARIEILASNWPNPVNVVELKAGGVTLIFPHNRSFVRLKATKEPAPIASSEALANALISPRASAMPGSLLPTMPQVPVTLPANEKVELKATGKKEEILGYLCEQYEIRERGESVEIWATDKLLPYQPYLHDQPLLRFGPKSLEAQWSESLMTRKLFPMRIVMRLEGGSERFRFEVKAIKPGPVDDTDGKLFQSPVNYFEVQPLPL